MGSNETGIDLTGTGSTITWDDATWILTSAFIIFTMQSGFGLLEAGNVSAKNEVNIMVKNVIDVVFGGITYWMFGFGLSFGQDRGSNPFCGVGYFFIDVHGDELGVIFSSFVFQLSFATTATTIVSGSMAERTKLNSYIVFSLVNTVVYCIPAHWAWATDGFLAKVGAVDFAGSGVVHMIGGVSGLVATLMLKPRHGRFDKDVPKPTMANPTNALIGMFMLWWGWLAFNCGSTFGISKGKWKLAAKTAVTTLLSSMSGGIVGIVMSAIVNKGKYDIGFLINSILGALVSITASCPLVHPWEAVIIGCIGAMATLSTDALLFKLKIDDPVSAVAVHGAGGVWGLLSVGLFASQNPLDNLLVGRAGVFHGGGFDLMGAQLLAILCEATWSALITFLLLFAIDKTMGLRMSIEDELLGADLVEHNIDRRSLFDEPASTVFSAAARRRQSSINYEIRRRMSESNGRRMSESNDRLGSESNGRRRSESNGRRMSESNGRRRSSIADISSEHTIRLAEILSNRAELMGPPHSSANDNDTNHDSLPSYSDPVSSIQVFNRDVIPTITVTTDSYRRPSICTTLSYPM